MLYLDDEQLCRTYGVSRVYTWSQRKKGLLPYSLIAGKIRYSADDIEAWLSNCKLAATKRSHGVNVVWRHRRVGGRRVESQSSVG